MCNGHPLATHCREIFAFGPPVLLLALLVTFNPMPVFILLFLFTYYGVNENHWGRVWATRAKTEAVAPEESVWLFRGAMGWPQYNLRCLI